jgi:hypothetical protein
VRGSVGDGSMFVLNMLVIKGLGNRMPFKETLKKMVG